MKILMGRVHYGLGDWIMFASLIKHINQQYPTTKTVDVDTTKVPVSYLPLFCKCDIQVRPVCNPVQSDYDVYIPHMVYEPVRKPNEHLLAAMIRVFNTHTYSYLRYDSSCLAQLCSPPAQPSDTERYNDTVLICPENGRAPGSACKDWGRDNFVALTEQLLAAGLQVIQIGVERGSNALCPGKHLHYSNLDLDVIVGFMRTVRGTVTLENGMSHLAGHHGATAYTIYRPMSPTKPEHAHYPLQVAFTGEYITPEEVAAYIIKDKKEVNVL